MACSATGANRDLAYVEEAVFKTTPANPFFKYLRTTGDSLKGTIETQSSAELIKGRVTSAPIMGRVSSGGDIQFELSYRSFDEFLEAALYGDWVPDASTTIVGAGTPVAGQKKLAVSDNGRSFTVEKFYSDINMYRRYKGVMVGGFNLSVPLDGKVTGSFNLLGTNNPLAEDTGILAGATYDPETPNTTDQFSSFIGNLVVRDADGLNLETIGYATQLDLAVTNNLAQDYALFTKETYCISPGTFGVTGTLGLYLKDKKYINAHVNWTTLQLSFALTDPSGNSYQFDLGSIKLTDIPDGVSGPATITMAIPFTSFGQNSLSIIKIPTAAENRMHMPIVTPSASIAAAGTCVASFNPDDIDDNLLVGVEGDFELVSAGTATTAEVRKLIIQTGSVNAGTLAIVVAGVTLAGAGLTIAAGLTKNAVAAILGGGTVTIAGWTKAVVGNVITFTKGSNGADAGVNSFTSTPTVAGSIRYALGAAALELITDGTAYTVPVTGTAMGGAGTRPIRFRVFPPASGADVPATPSPIVERIFIVS